MNLELITNLLKTKKSVIGGSKPLCRMWQFESPLLGYKKLINTLVVLVLLFSNTTFIFAEGSATLYPSGALGKRAYLFSNNVTQQYNLFPTMGTMKVFVNNGETLYLGSSALGIGHGEIIIRKPNGTTITVSTTANGGLIQNREQEKAGPYFSATVRPLGYTPYIYNVDVTGVWEIDFISPQPIQYTISASILKVDGTIDINADANWTQPTANIDNSANDVGAATIAAFDISVASNASSTTLIDGRVFCTVFNGNVYGAYGTSTSDESISLKTKFYVLTDVGFVYKVDLNGQNGAGFNFFSNNKGRQTAGTGTDVTTTAPYTYKSGKASYLSAEIASTTYTTTTQLYMYDPRIEDNVVNGFNEDVTHKLFFNKPDVNLPQTADIRYNGGAATTTWLRKSVTSPTITNLAVVGAEGGLSGYVGPEGSIINFTSNVAGDYTITITATGYTTRTLTGHCNSGNNSITWDGKDGAVSPVSIATGTSLTVTGRILTAEVHFPLNDVEINPKGLIIELLDPATYNSYSPIRDTTYWDDRVTFTLSITGVAPSPNFDLDGASSTLNGHKWGTYYAATPNIAGQYGDKKLFDTWSYIRSSVASASATVNAKNIDLAVSSITPSVSSAVVGGTITYTIVVANPSSTGYTDNAVAATFGFTAPAGFNITSATYGSGTGTFTENSRSSVSGNTFTANFDLTSNGTITYTITGTVGAGMAHISNNTVTSYVIRPADYTDKDATSDILGAPTDAQLECDGGTSGVGCNNIKTTTITVTNTVPVAVNDAGSVDEDATLTVTEANGVIKNATTGDSDVDGDVLTVTAIRTGNVEGSGTAGTVGSPLTGTYGQLTLNANGSYTYVANNATALNAGETAYDYFNYTISDGYGGTDIATITITINGNNEYCAWRSQKSDVWSDNTVWQGLNCTTGEWENAPFAPNNDRPIYVFDNVNIPTGTSISADSLYIKPSGVLTVPSTSTLTVTDQLVFEIDADGTVGELKGICGAENTTNVTIGTNAKIIARKTLDTSWDFISFPFEVTENNVFIAGTDDNATWGGLESRLLDNSNFIIAEYDGLARAADATLVAPTNSKYFKSVSPRTLAAAKGYIITGGLAPVSHVIDFTSAIGAQLEFCDVQKTANAYDATGTCNDGWNLVGTPYVSDFNLKYATALAPYYIFGGSSYSTIAPNATYQLSPFSAYFLQVIGESNSTLSYNDAGLTDFSTPAPPYRMNDVILEVTQGIYSDNTLIRFEENATAGYDSYKDGIKMFSSNASIPQIYTEADGACSSLAVNCLPSDTESVEVKLRSGKTGATSIKLASNSILTDVTEVILYDTETGVKTNLTTGGVYVWENTSIGITDRFRILVSNENASGFKNNLDNDVTVIVNGNNLSFKGIDGKAKVNMYDVVGKLMYHYSDITDGGSFKVNTSGVYILDISSETQKVKVKVLMK